VASRACGVGLQPLLGLGGWEPAATEFLESVGGVVVPFASARVRAAAAAREVAAEAGLQVEAAVGTGGVAGLTACLGRR